MEIVNTIFRTLWLYLNVFESLKCRRLARAYSIAKGCKRIYLYHIRKTGGTSLNYMFLSLAGREGKELYYKMTKRTNLRIISEGKIFAGWNKRIIEQGDYYYAFSHIPAHELSLPDKTFTITCLRDPIERVLSHYRMLVDYKENNISHPGMKVEGKWLGRDFSDFLANIPKEQLLNQIYMFSKSLDPDEAFERIRRCSYFFFTEAFSEGIEKLSTELQIRLEPIHIRKSKATISLSQKDSNYLMSLMEPEILLYGRLRELKTTSSPDSD